MSNLFPFWKRKKKKKRQRDIERKKSKSGKLSLPSLRNDDDEHDDDDERLPVTECDKFLKSAEKFSTRAHQFYGRRQSNTGGIRSTVTLIFLNNNQKRETFVKR